MKKDRQNSFQIQNRSWIQENTGVIKSPEMQLQMQLQTIYLGFNGDDMISSS